MVKYTYNVTTEEFSKKLILPVFKLTKNMTAERKNNTNIIQKKKKSLYHKCQLL